MVVSTGTIVGIAVRTAKMGPMREIDSARAEVGAGIDGDLPVSVKRGITFLSAEQWADTLRDLGVALPWHTRRANVLVRGLRLGDLLGRTIRLGMVEVYIHKETKPCDNMDKLHAGLQNALVPDMRGGVYGEVLIAGQFAVGDSVAVVE
ncbi:MAG: MOSC domain-containing protein [Candidatus Hydrogenedentales bacterium]|jgi:MOSC domain-containing protein YiiM